MSEKRDNFDYDYQPLIDGKINGVEIKSITVRECECSTGKKCDGMHKIRINNIKDNMLNFWSEQRKFSIDELEKLNYIDKLRIPVDEDRDENVRNNC